MQLFITSENIKYNNGGSPHDPTDDCVNRAIAILTGKPYSDFNCCAETELPKYGFHLVYYDLRREVNLRLSDYAFAPDRDYGVSVACPKGTPAIAGHFFAILKGVIHDMYDPRFAWRYLDKDQGYATWAPIGEPAPEAVCIGESVIMGVWVK